MEESEVDEWFSEHREKLEEAFFAAVSAGKGSDKAKLEFDLAYRKLIVDFQKMQTRLYERKVHEAQLHAPIERFKKRISLAQEQTVAWFKDQRRKIKKWFFDRKIRKLIKQR